MRAPSVLDYTIMTLMLYPHARLKAVTCKNSQRSIKVRRIGSFDSGAISVLDITDRPGRTP